MLFLVINCLSNHEFRRRRKVVQVVGKEQHYLENEREDILKNEKLLAMDGRMDEHRNEYSLQHQPKETNNQIG